MMFFFLMEFSDFRESGVFVVVKFSENRFEKRRGGWEGELY